MFKVLKMVSKVTSRICDYLNSVCKNIKRYIKACWRYRYLILALAVVVLLILLGKRPNVETSSKIDVNEVVETKEVYNAIQEENAIIFNELSDSIYDRINQILGSGFSSDPTDQDASAE